MIKQRTGIVLESFRLRIKDGINVASTLGFKGIQIDATQREIAPENISQTGRRELKRILDMNRLCICALRGELGAGFTNHNEFDYIIQRTKEIINLALDLQTAIITVQIGSIPTDQGTTHWHALNTALSEIGQHAENYGCRLAVKASYVNYSTLKDFLKSLHTDGVKVIYDPASLMTNNLDPIKGVYELHEYIVHTNLWDTRQTEEGRQIEVPIGDGIIPVEEFASSLDSTGYYGFYVINSKTMQNPVESIKKSKEFLDRF
ncbi:sugar phosphate isomerase/epimerase family protein [Candidatus Scalindua japonica]|nr:sugar phosphate isomerase/epimerase family protein [Candidatus Scalindua japonica]